jgi:hypothetical protein
LEQQNIKKEQNPSAPVGAKWQSKVKSFFKDKFSKKGNTAPAATGIQP